MAEYVDKQKARDLFQRKCYNVSDRINSVEVGMFVEGIMQVLDEATAADVQPVRYGRWEDSGNFYFKKCSECGSKWDISITNNYFAHYCPRCGAEMENPKTIKG